MSLALGALLGYAGWALGLAFAVITWRTLEVLRGDKQANEFPASAPHGSDLYWRLNRAHLNTLENLPIFGAVVVVGVLLEVASLGFHHGAGGVLVARIAQSVAHVSGGSAGAVKVRAGFYLAQLLCIIWMMVQILRTVFVP